MGVYCVIVIFVMLILFLSFMIVCLCISVLFVSCDIMNSFATKFVGYAKVFVFFVNVLFCVFV